MIELEHFSVAQARKSTLVVAGAFALLSGWQLYRGHSTSTLVFVAAAAVLLVCAAITPAALFFNKWWMALAGVLGYINSRILLSLLFFLVMTPVGLFARLVGYDPLTRRKGNEASYWRARAKTRQQRADFEHSF